MLLQTINDVSVFVEILKYAPSLAVAFIIGIPTIRYFKRRAEELQKQLNIQQDKFVESLHTRDRELADMALKTQIALREVANLLTQVESRNLVADNELKTQMTNTVNQLSKLTTILEMTLDFIKRQQQHPL